MRPSKQGVAHAVSSDGRGAPSLDKATRLDRALEQLLDAALASQRGVRLDMDAADKTPAQGDEPASDFLVQLDSRIGCHELPSSYL